MHPQQTFQTFGELGNGWHTEKLRQLKVDMKLPVYS
jgi:hypothetical protein